MRIYNINPTIFMARTTTLPKTESEKANVKFTKENFYNQIDGFLNQQYDKKKYLKIFAEGIDKIVEQESLPEYNPIERKYINNLISILDLSENLNEIPDNYLKNIMQNLLKSKK